MTTPNKTAPPPARVAMIQTGQALMSLRDSGYDLSAAIAEVVDNSIEANANNISIDLIEGDGKKHITSIVFVDDGAGMDPSVLQHYLVLGYSTRWMRTDTIGKYGVGAKLAALNFATKIDVWSRQAADAPWLHVGFDLVKSKAAEEAGEENPFGIDPPAPRDLPPEATMHAPKGAGTVVLWSAIDRLQHGRFASDANQLTIEVQKEVSRIFREFIDGGIRISVNGTALAAHDPLYKMKGTWADVLLTKADPEKLRGGGTKHYAPQVIADREPIPLKGGKAYLTVVLYPEEVTRRRGLGGDELAKRLRLPENEGAISFMRSRREIAYTNVPRIFPRGVSEPDRFIGIEVAFSPDLDDYFGVRNVKRGVEPHGELRDKIRAKLTTYIPTARKLLENRWGKAAQKEQVHAGEHAAITEAVKEVGHVLPKGTPQPADDKKRRDAYEQLAKDTGHAENQKEKDEYIGRIKDLPFVLESVDYPGKMFIDIQIIDRQVIIRVNTRHRFYQELWKPLQELSKMDPGAVSGDDAVKAARRSVEGLSLMLIAYGKAVAMEENGPEIHEDLTAYWGQFIDTLMGKVKGVI
ncbi:ATP-binding protein [Caulobacter sp. 602-1]|uniref:ATP-binding protein n=1 Tax=Caulobacter sp. 602-1 TaxID=2492472 RepID=UPI000F62F6DA|nr:ATP-binding protein [Caulobacter sp. 602-1]RRN63486.1 hypothetical protein EIK80_16870 [Caulobacter sp. 602-1]